MGETNFETKAPKTLDQKEDVDAKKDESQNSEKTELGLVEDFQLPGVSNRGAGEIEEELNIRVPKSLVDIRLLRV